MGQEVLKVISGKDEPFRNVVVFDGPKSEAVLTDLKE